MADKIINALSTDESDQQLLNEGLVQKGLIGYVLTTPTANSINCIILKISFKKGTDYLYTTDLNRETLTNLTFNNSGSLGSVFTTRRPNTLRLNRFFNKTRLAHLFVTRPDREALLQQGYKDETDNNPIYILDRQIDNSLPLYFYTNSDYSPRPFRVRHENTTVSQTFSISDAKQELLDIIEDNNLSSSRFSIVLEDQSVTVHYSDTFYNFYINLQENKEFFTVRSNPSGDESDYIKNNISSWINVIHEFQLWIDRIRKIPRPATQIPDINKAKGIHYLEGPSDFEFRNDNVKPVLNVEIQAEIFFKIIQGIKQNETGLLMGVFGRWGRGKTFFWKELKKKLATSQNIRFSTVDFHAWKYQDTPASWAYLYEQFVIRFYNRPRIFAWINFKFLNRIILNMKRLGMANLFIGVLYLVVAFIWVFFVDFQFKWNLILNILSGIGISTVVSGIYYYFSYSGRAKDLFKSYWSEVSFKEFLGVQAEIQKELRDLMQAWIPQKRVGARRLILFVDDIDRCNEARIIEVIDSLKVMIDDPVISDRVIVIAAIDEIVLKRAIKNKYYKSVTRDLSLTDDKRKIVLENLCKEYMDKLFISGFKLASLSRDQNEEIFRNLVSEKTFIEAKSVETTIRKTDTNGASKKDAEAQPKGTINRLEETNSASDLSDANTRSDSGEYISFTPKKEFEIMEYELDFLLKAVRKYSNATPRAIRIFYYRYLLAKSFKEILVKRDSRIYNEWNNNQDSKSILPLLMIEYSNQKTQEDILTEIERIEQTDENMVEISVLGETFRFSRDLYLTLLRIVEIVVPY